MLILLEFAGFYFGLRYHIKQVKIRRRILDLLLCSLQKNKKSQHVFFAMLRIRENYAMSAEKVTSDTLTNINSILFEEKRRVITKSRIN